MKKLSKIFKEVESDLEDWSASLEEHPVDVAMQRGANKKVPQNVQKVWGGPKLQDNDLKPDSSLPDMTKSTLANRYKLSPDDMERIQNGDFSTVMNKVGDPSNFAEDVHDAVGYGPAQSINNYLPKLNANGPMRLSSALNKTQTAPVESGVKKISNPNLAHEPTQFSNSAIEAPTKLAPNPNQSTQREMPNTRQFQLRKRV